MQLYSETFEVILKSKCSIKHINCIKADSDWKSSLKIMFNDFGINNLNTRKCHSFSPSWTSIWISITLCFLLVALDVQAYPTMSRPLRDHSRHLRMSSIASATGSSPKQFNGNPSSSGDTLSLSIFSPLDILRQNMLLEIQRKRLRAKQRQVQSNQEYLDRIGR